METKERRWMVASLFWLPFIICIILLFVMDIFQYSNYQTVIFKIEEEPPIIDQKSLKGFLIKTKGCRIPYMDPFHYSIKKFINGRTPPNCNEGIPALVDANSTTIFLVNSSIGNYTHDVHSLRCCYQPFRYSDDYNYNFDEKCIPFGDSVKISHEFIKVQCSKGDNLVYTDYFSFVPMKKPHTREFTRKPLNVLIIGLDAVSRLNFHRQMPQTVDFLLKNLSAVELLGYNKVGDNTFPNLVPVLSGMSEDELYSSCWHGKTFDECPLIWKEFAQEGFVTAFGEDASWMGIFNYLRKGFHHQPTDYFWGPFNRLSEKEIGNKYKLNVMQCVGAREVYKVLLNYIENFVMRISRSDLPPFFAFFWGASLTHDDLNMPQLGDEPYLNFFQNLKQGGFLDNTVMVVMSDHGIRWGDIRHTYQGRMEERLPFLFMVLPEWYKRQYSKAYNNLLKNVRRLTTPYDLHETLKDLVDPFKLTHEFLQSRFQEKRRGYSLFSEIMPNRSCQDAAISSHWCTCQQSIEVDSDDSLVVGAAHYAVDFMNFQLKGYAQCANLTLYNISDARKMIATDHILEGGMNPIKDYTIILQTMPGNGIFEVTVRPSYKNKTYQFEVMGTISRLNLYGKQSACITDFHLKLYCYCKNLLGIL